MKNVHAILYIIGDGPEKNKLENQIFELNIQDKVKIIGNLSDDEKINYFKKASIFVYPTIAENGEAMPIAPLEAMAMGCVPVVPNFNCFSDYIKDKYNGRVYSYTKKSDSLEYVLLQLVCSPLERNEIANNASIVKETHNISKMGFYFLDSFTNLLSTS
jgi:glycosyltransferase involved in cell wall biosynthesis